MCQAQYQVLGLVTTLLSLQAMNPSKNTLIYQFHGWLCWMENHGDTQSKTSYHSLPCFQSPGSSFPSGSLQTLICQQPRDPLPHTHGASTGRQRALVILHKTGEFLHLLKPNQQTLREPHPAIPSLRRLITSQPRNSSNDSFDQNISLSHSHEHNLEGDAQKRLERDVGLDAAFKWLTV